MNKLEEFAKAIESFEDDKHESDDIPSRNNNPGALRYSKFQESKRNGFAYFKDYQTGFNALLWDIKQKCLGNTSTGLTSDSSILNFFEKYAPRSDGNNPVRYANFVASKLQISTDTKLKDIYSEEVTTNLVLTTVATIRLHLVIDNTSRGYFHQIEKAFENVRNDYLQGTDNQVGLSYTYSYKDLSKIPWIVYNDKKLGPSTEWIKEHVNELSITVGDNADCIMYLIDNSNWHQQGILGWALPGFVDKYTVQVINTNEIFPKNIYIEMVHELAHEHDDRYKFKFGRSLSGFFGVGSYDYDIVHKKLPGYVSEVPEYYAVLNRMKDILVAMFVRGHEYNRLNDQQRRFLQLSLIERTLALMYQLLQYLYKPHSFKGRTK